MMEDIDLDKVTDEDLLKELEKEIPKESPRTKAKNMKSSSSSSTSSSSSSENNPVTIKSINSASNYAMKSMLGDKNRDVYAGEMQSKKDSASTYQKT